MVVCRLSAVQAGMWKHRRLVMRQSGWVSVLERVSPNCVLLEYSYETAGVRAVTCAGS